MRSTQGNDEPTSVMNQDERVYQRVVFYPSVPIPSHVFVKCQRLSQQLPQYSSALSWVCLSLKHDVSGNVDIQTAECHHWGWQPITLLNT